VGAIVNNMKDHLKPTSKKLYIYSAVSNKFLLCLSSLAFSDSPYTKWPNVVVTSNTIILV